MAISSRQLVYVNGEATMEADLHPGDLIKAGNLQLVFESDEKVQEPPRRTVSLTTDTGDGNDQTYFDYGTSTFCRIKHQYDARRRYRQTVRAGDTLERMQETMLRCKSYIHNQNRYEQFSLALMCALLVAAVGAVLWSAALPLSNLLFFPLVGCVGQLIGLTVRYSGRGFDAKFAHLGGVCALCCGMAVNGFEFSGQEKRLLPNTVAMQSPIASYELDSSVSLGGLGYNSDPTDQSEMTVQVIPTKKKAPAKSVMEAPQSTTMQAALFNPRQLIAYAIAFTLACRSSRRRLTLDEAIMIHCS